MNRFQLLEMFYFDLNFSLDMDCASGSYVLIVGVKSVRFSGIWALHLKMCSILFVGVFSVT